MNLNDISKYYEAKAAMPTEYAAEPGGAPEEALRAIGGNGKVDLDALYNLYGGKSGAIEENSTGNALLEFGLNALANNKPSRSKFGGLAKAGQDLIASQRGREDVRENENRGAAGKILGYIGDQSASKEKYMDKILEIRNKQADMGLKREQLDLTRQYREKDPERQAYEWLIKNGETPASALKQLEALGGRSGGRSGAAIPTRGNYIAEGMKLAARSSMDGIPPEGTAERLNAEYDEIEAMAVGQRGTNSQGGAIDENSPIMPSLLEEYTNPQGVDNFNRELDRRSMTSGGGSVVRTEKNRAMYGGGD
jgi:hypothetical protein